VALVKENIRKRARTVALLFIAVIFIGCSRRDPLILPAVRQELQTALPFDANALVTKPPADLQQVPIETPNDVVDNARKVVAPSPETPTVELTLADVRKQALENNLDLQVQLYDPAIAQAAYQAESWKFEAVLNASASQQKTFDSFGNPEKIASLTPTVVVPTQAGGTATLSLPFTRIDDQGSIFGVPVGVTDEPTIQLGLTQPLLRGAGFGINYASINVAGLVMRQTDARTKLAAIQVMANAEQSYWQHYAANENLKIQLQEYDYALEQVRTARRLVEEGARTKIEITRAEGDAARRFDAILMAENTRRQTELALKRIINSPNLPLQSQTLIIPKTEPSPKGFTFDRAAVTALALKNRMELFQNEVQMSIDRISLDVSRNRRLPDVTMNFNYSFAGSATTFQKSLDELFRNRLVDTYNYGLSASIPLWGNQQAKYQVVQSALNLAKTETNQRALELSVRQDVLNAINSVELNWQRILSNRAAVDRSTETYQDNRIEFQLGKITSTELSLTLDQLAQAQGALIVSQSDYQNSLVDLAFATGTVLGQAGVIWSPRTQ
jgi:outer membrane protein TolC